MGFFEAGWVRQWVSDQGVENDQDLAQVEAPTEDGFRVGLSSAWTTTLPSFLPGV